MQHDGLIRLTDPTSGATLKTISFFNAYCTNMGLSFMPRQNGGAGSSLMQLQISSQRVAVGAITHDNNWPLPSHGVGETFVQQSLPKSKSGSNQEPGIVSDIAHTALDIVGLISAIGEVADGTNALFYLAEGNKTDAALSLAAMVPVAGWAATGGKLVRKGLKLAGKTKALKRAKQIANPALKTSLPGWKKIGIDIEHIASGHMTGSKRVSILKDLFPSNMNKKQVESAVRSAYKNVSDKITTQGDRVLVRGTSDSGIKIEMWVNKVTKTLETAYPVKK